MSRWVKVVLAVLLLPACLGASQAMFWVLVESGSPTTASSTQAEGVASSQATVEVQESTAVLTGRVERQVQPPPPLPKRTSLTLAPLLAGAACWVVVYILLPRPMWVYVFGHELTHVIWAWVFEARVKKFHVSSRGGHVILDRVNFLIVLAPYFFPLYALCVAVVYAIGNWLSDWEAYRVAFLLLLGASYAFHVTLTLHALRSEQTDITSQGWFFSVVVIWLGNLLVLVPGLCLLLGVSLEGAFGEWMRATWRAVRIMTWTS